MHSQLSSINGIHRKASNKKKYFDVPVLACQSVKRLETEVDAFSIFQTLRGLEDRLGRLESYVLRT